MATYQDAGYRGTVISLGNTLGRQGFGIRVTTKTQSLAGGTSYSVLQSNPRRVWAIIQDTHATEPAYIGLGDAADATGIYAAANGGGIQLDRQLPWSGAVAVYSTNACSMNIIEAELSG